MTVEEALDRISPDCSYDTWYKVAAALYSELGDDGFELFDEWSRRSHSKYPSRHGCRRQWDFSKRLDQITIRSLYWMATHDEQ
jgi:putative DNA primase/helicase